MRHSIGPSLEPGTSPDTETADRLWQYVDRDRSDCWDWTGPRQGRDGAYGAFTFRGRKSQAHRAMYELIVGPIPDGLVLDHLCCNKSCVNPSHLEPVTQQTNILRGPGLAAQQAKRTHCPHGHPYSGDNLYVNQGRRYCRTCARERDRQRQSAACESRCPPHQPALDTGQAPTPEQPHPFTAPFSSHEQRRPG